LAPGLAWVIHKYINRTLFLLGQGVHLIIDPPKRSRDTLHSCDLWDLPGGATADECFNIVKTKTEAREAKVSRVAEKKEENKKKAIAVQAAGLKGIVMVDCDLRGELGGRAVAKATGCDWH